MLAVREKTFAIENILSKIEATVVGRLPSVYIFVLKCSDLKIVTYVILKQQETHMCQIGVCVNYFDALF